MNLNTLFFPLNDQAININGWAKTKTKKIYQNAMFIATNASVSRQKKIGCEL